MVMVMAAAEPEGQAVREIRLDDAEVAHLMGEVDAFVASHPHIEVSRTGLAVPRECREGFYGLLADVRRELALRVVGESRVRRAEEEAHALLDSRARLVDRLGLEAYALPSALEKYCADVLDGGSQGFLTHQLSYVEGRLTASELGERARAEIALSFDRLEVAAYEACLAFEALNLLEPTRAYLALTPDARTVEAVPATRLELGYQQYSATLRLPEAVFECPSGVVAVRFELSSEIDFYRSKPLRRRDYSSGGATQGVVGRRCLLAYRTYSAEAVPLLADRDRSYVMTPTALLGSWRACDIDGGVYAKASLARTLDLAPRKGSFFAMEDDALEAARELAHTCGVEVGLYGGGIGGGAAAAFVAALQG